MANYSVVWEIDIEADSPEEAAETARYYQTVSGTTATVFEVWDKMGKITRVDLLENEEQTEEHSSQTSLSVPRHNRYARERKQNQVSVRIAPGKQITLSPGEHSQLIRAIVEDFGSRFVPGAELIYVGDTGEKWGYFDAALLATLGVSIEAHGKMPDVVLHCPKRNWLILVESVTNHGPVDGKRHAELARLFAGSKSGLVYVTAFRNRSIMGRYLGEIAWETEVWVADAPSHLIHFNGERFLGPHSFETGPD